MPYAYIHYIKVKIEILNDKRFIFDLNETEKWLYLGLLILAGSTQNKIPDDANYLKNRLNLTNTNSEITEMTTKIVRTFPKLIRNRGFLKFKNFSKLHNIIGKSEGSPKEVHRKASIDKIILDYIRIKGWVSLTEKNKNLTSEIYQRNGRVTKRFLTMVNDDTKIAGEAIEGLGKTFDGKGLSWTLETIVKHFPDWLKNKKEKTPAQVELLKALERERNKCRL